MSDIWLTPLVLRLPTRPDFNVPRILLSSDNAAVLQLPLHEHTELISLALPGLVSANSVDPTLFWRFDSNLDTGRPTKADGTIVIVDSICSRRIRTDNGRLELSISSSISCGLLFPVQVNFNTEPLAASLIEALRIAGVAVPGSLVYVYRSSVDRPTSSSFKSRLGAEFVCPLGNHAASAHMWRDTVHVD